MSAEMSLSLHELLGRWPATFAFAEARDQFCYYCNRNIVGRVTRDHVVPKSSGGAGLQYNKVPSCAECNVAKGSQSLLVFLLEKPLGRPVPTRAPKQPPRRKPSARRQYETARRLARVRRRFLSALSSRALDLDMP